VQSGPFAIGGGIRRSRMTDVPAVRPEQHLATAATASPRSEGARCSHEEDERAEYACTRVDSAWPKGAGGAAWPSRGTSCRGVHNGELTWRVNCGNHMAAERTGDGQRRQQRSRRAGRPQRRCADLTCCPA
jgi:hypothetical protein